MQHFDKSIISLSFRLQSQRYRASLVIHVYSKMAASVIHATLTRNNIANYLYYQLLAQTMSEVSNNLVLTNVQELFLPLSHVHSYGARSSTSQNFYRKKSNLEIRKNSFSRLGPRLQNEIPTKLRTLSKHEFKFNIRASYCLIYWRLA